jgi:hypothetical protein
MCVQSLITASELITKRKTSTDGRLFLIKHLLILREQIAPFNVDFAVKEMVIDFSKLKEAAMKFLNKKSKFLSMNRDNAFLDFLLQGTLQVKESFIDSKREVDKHLKQTCELYIADLSNQLCGAIRQYLQRALVISKMNHDNTNTQKVSLRQQPFAKPEILHDLILENYNLMKKTLPEIFKIMSLYLANRDTEQILFKPIKVSLSLSNKSYRYTFSMSSLSRLIRPRARASRIGPEFKTDSKGPTVKITAKSGLIFIKLPLRLSEKCVACASRRIQIVGKKYLVSSDRLLSLIVLNYMTCDYASRRVGYV